MDDKNEKYFRVIKLAQIFEQQFHFEKDLMKNYGVVPNKSMDREYWQIIKSELNCDWRWAREFLYMYLEDDYKRREQLDQHLKELIGVV